MVRVFSLLLLLIAAIAPAQAAPPKWNVDPAKSSLSWVVEINEQTVTGKFKAFGALIAFDAKDLANSSAKITVDMTEPKSGDQTRDQMLLQPEWFNVLDFPQAVFQTTSFVSKGGNAYDVRGKLTLKGVTKEIALPMTIATNGNAATAKGELSLARRDFNVGASEAFAKDAPVTLTVKVMVNVAATRAK
jgi:polyisoprenoid-binding protein YceI